ncbi:MAG TPA: DUF896 domain-containing protein [Clostridiaceae bacterium]|nr:DUF896 domain-containing protein [Clostridiaceae bacterium]
MDIDKAIERINFLYKKSKEEGLTETEKQEQKELREYYVGLVKNNLRSQLETKVKTKSCGPE